MVIGAAHYFPCVAVIIDVTPPGEGLVADPQSSCRGTFTKLGEIRCGTVDPAKRLGVNG